MQSPKHSSFFKRRGQVPLDQRSLRALMEGPFPSEGRYTCTHARTHTCTQMYTYTCTWAHMNTHVHIHMHTRAHTHIHTHAHKQITQPQGPVIENIYLTCGSIPMPASNKSLSSQPGHPPLVELHRQSSQALSPPLQPAEPKSTSFFIINLCQYSPAHTTNQPILRYSANLA